MLGFGNYKTRLTVSSQNEEGQYCVLIHSITRVAFMLHLFNLLYLFPARSCINYK